MQFNNIESVCNCTSAEGVKSTRNASLLARVDVLLLWCEVYVHARRKPKSYAKVERKQ